MGQRPRRVVRCTYECQLEYTNSCAKSSTPNLRDPYFVPLIRIATKNVYISATYRDIFSG
jgi:hypothetical protein